MYISRYLYIYIYLHIYLFTYIYIYIYMYIYIYIHIHTYMNYAIFLLFTLCLFKLSKPNASWSQMHSIYAFYISTLCYIIWFFFFFFIIFVNNWFLWKRIINHNCSITSAHINSYLSNIATRQSKDHKALRLLNAQQYWFISNTHFHQIRSY